MELDQEKPVSFDIEKPVSFDIEKPVSFDISSLYLFKIYLSCRCAFLIKVFD